MNLTSGYVGGVIRCMSRIRFYRPCLCETAATCFLLRIRFRLCRSVWRCVEGWLLIRSD